MKEKATFKKPSLIRVKPNLDPFDQKTSKEDSP